MRDESVLLAKTTADLASDFGPPGTGPLLQFLKWDDHANLAKDIGDQHYQQALLDAFKESVALWEEPLEDAAKQQGHNGLAMTLKGEVAAVDVGGDLAEEYLILRDRATMVATRDTLFQQLVRLQGNDPQTLAQWQDIYTRLHGDPAAEHRAFLQWLANHQVSRQDLMRKVLTDVNRNPKAAAGLARGLAIVDPSQEFSGLNGIPGLNPDFVAAFNRCNQIALTLPRQITTYGAQRQADCGASSDCPQSALAARDAAVARAGEDSMMTCTKYGDGSYIPAFGTPRGGVAGPGLGALPGGRSAQNSGNLLTNPAQTGGGRPSAGRQQVRSDLDGVWTFNDYTYRMVDESGTQTSGGATTLLFVRNQQGNYFLVIGGGGEGLCKLLASRPPDQALVRTGPGTYKASWKWQSPYVADYRESGSASFEITDAGLRGYSVLERWQFQSHSTFERTYNQGRWDAFASSLWANSLRGCQF
jgi:hypothetical protein